MSVLLILLVGLFVGAVARMIMPGRGAGGFVVPILLGVAGAALGHFIGRGLGWYHAGGTGPGVLAAFIGAVVVLVPYRFLSPRKVAPR